MKAQRTTIKKIGLKLLLVLLAVLLVSMGGFLLWASNPAQAEAQALKILQSDGEVRFEQVNQWLVFSPTDAQSRLGLILYPGGRVDYRAYAPHASAIANQGFTVIIVPMPLNLAFFGINRADDVISAFPEINQWAIGGHSLGGAMTAEFIKNDPNKVDALVLWASYPGENNNLSGSNLPILTVSAENDGLATPEDIAASTNRLPAETTFVEISGGNHAGFGWYGAQNGDGEALLSKTEQQDLIFQATTAFLQSIED